MAFCGKCGNEVKDGVKFCTKCGNPISNVAKKSKEAKASAGVNPGIIVAIILGIIVVLGGLGIGGYFLYNNVILAEDDDEDDKDRKKDKDDSDEDEDIENTDDVAENETTEVKVLSRDEKAELINSEYGNIACVTFSDRTLRYKTVSDNGYDMYVSDDLGVEGCIYSDIEVQSEIPVAYEYSIVKNSSSDSSDIVLKAITINDDGSINENEMTLVPCAFGNGSGDDYSYSFYRKDNMIVIISENGYFVNADGTCYQAKAYTFDGNSFTEVLSESESGSDFGNPDGWPEIFAGIADRFDAIGLYKSANMMRENYNKIAIVPGEDIEKLFAVKGRNSYLGSNNGWDPLSFTIKVSMSKGETSEYIIEDSDSRYLSASDLSGLTSEELRYARNEIYARHGRRFKDEALQSYFDSLSWYDGYRDEVAESELSDIEKANRDLISSME